MASATPRATPLTMVSGAVAGDDLQSVAASTAEALGRPVAIALPARAAPVCWPADVAAPDVLLGLSEQASSLIDARDSDAPHGIADSVPIQIGPEIVGIVAALGESPLRADERAWLDAAAAAAAVTALMRDAHEGDLEQSRRALLRALSAGRVADPATLASQARRLGFELDSGAVAICAQWPQDGAGELPDAPSALLADVGEGRILGLSPLDGAAAGSDPGGPDALAIELRRRGMEVALSGPRRDLGVLHEALREAELLVELAGAPEASLAAQEETYRLLIGVLLRDPGEVEQLRERTIAPLEHYDQQHDTELVATLQAFLAHHGSTTETAEAMRLHRHTVGYRLSRVQEVSGLSPYESDGRERLSLGLKAHQILEADARRSRRENM
ncbi:MAG TPA: helix-turn-helix domain-containing protein [Solirubrobacteraceae bacterium]|nr:helix-turn-helix domain-containing protein [Solirubrobacteraceae bacterium]